MTCITFTPDDMLIKNPKHDRPLYFTGYIGSSQVDRIQVDPGFALSIIPLRLIQHLGGTFKSPISNQYYHIQFQHHGYSHP